MRRQSFVRTMFRIDWSALLERCSIFVFSISVAFAGANFAALAEGVTAEKVTAALPSLDRLADDIIKRGDVPGLAIGVVFNDKVIYLKGFGVREIGKPRLVDADTVFQIASFSKPIASTVVAALVGDGVVSWDSKISDLDPEFRFSDPYATAEVTIRDLFSHRSGLWGDAGNDLEAYGYDQHEILRRIRFLRPAGSFRATYAYSNFGLTEGAVAAARATGTAWADLAESRLFKPLGMTKTSFRYADFLARPNRAELHAFIDRRWQAVVKRQPDPQSPAGGVSSNVRDLTTWVRLQMGGGALNGVPVIKPEALAETHQPIMLSGKNPITGEPSYYGLGWADTSDSHGTHWIHSGAFSAGARTVADILPADHLGIVVLANAFPSGVPEGIAASFYDQVFDGKVSKDWVAQWNDAFGTAYFKKYVEPQIAQFAQVPAHPTAALPVTAYVGTYANGYVGQAVVREKGGELILELGPKGALALPLKHFDRDIFLYYPEKEAPDLPFAIQFVVGPDLKAVAAVMNAAVDYGQEILLRTSTRTSP